MFFLHRHGLERLYAGAQAEASASCGEGETVDLAREATTPGGLPPDSAWAQLRFGLAALGARVVASVAGEERLGLPALRGGGGSVTASLTLRRYAADGRLGAHTDANLLTMLWADNRGLQVYRPPKGTTVGSA